MSLFFHLRSLVLSTALIAAAESHALSVTYIVANETCGSDNGWIQAGAFGGAAPYNYSWSSGAVTSNIQNLTAGWYTLTVTDDIGTVLVDSVEIIDQPFLDLQGAINQQGLHPCPDQCNGVFNVHEEYINHIGSLFYSVDQGGYLGLDPNNSLPMFGPYCGGETVTVQVSDGVGCIGNAVEFIVAPLDNNPVVVSQITGACGGANGTAVINVPNDPLVGVQANLLDSQLNFVAGPFMFGGAGAVQNLAAGHYVVERDWFGLLYPGCVDTVGFDVPDLGPACGTVSGSLYFDHDQDCVQDANDPGIPYRVLTIQPAGEYAITDVDGTYDHGLAYGNFTIEQPADDIVQLCPANNPEPFTIDNLNPAAVIDFADSSTIALDVSATMFSNAARPGFNLTYFGRANNLSGQQSGALDLTIAFDPLLSFVSATPAPSSTTATSVTWNGLAALSGFGEANVSVQLSVPANPGLIGTVLSATIDVSQSITESSLANNTTVLFRTITGSYDPNDKTAITSSNSSSTEYFINTDEYIDYVIRFQNTGTDTAFTVVITDTLQTELDMSTFLQGLASHPFTVSFKPGRVVEWRFETILLPDSNTNEPASHGLVTFRIQPQLPLVAGTIVSNAADIYFDFNPPVRTPPAVLVAQSPMGISYSGASATLLLYPQPASDRVYVKGATANSTYQLLQADGRLMRSGPFDENGIDVSGLSAGTYLVVVIDPHGGADRARLVKH